MGVGIGFTKAQIRQLMDGHSFVNVTRHAGPAVDLTRAEEETGDITSEPISAIRDMTADRVAKNKRKREELAEKKRQRANEKEELKKDHPLHIRMKHATECKNQRLSKNKKQHADRQSKKKKPRREGWITMSQALEKTEAVAICTREHVERLRREDPTPWVLGKNVLQFAKTYNHGDIEVDNGEIIRADGQFSAYDLVGDTVVDPVSAAQSLQLSEKDWTDDDLFVLRFA